MVEEKQEGGCILPPPPGKIGLMAQPALFLELHFDKRIQDM